MSLWGTRLLFRFFLLAGRQVSFLSSSFCVLSSPADVPACAFVYKALGFTACPGVYILEPFYPFPEGRETDEGGGGVTTCKENGNEKESIWFLNMN